MRISRPLIAVLLAVALGWHCPLRGDEAADQFRVAAAHYRRENWQLAADEFRTFLQGFPRDRRAPDVRFFLAETLMQLQQFGPAQNEYRAFAEAYPAHQYARQARFRLGESAFLADQFVAAETELRRFVSADGKDSLTAYSLVYLGEIELARENYREAEEKYRAALGMFSSGPLSFECRLGLARALESQGRSAEAVRFYQFVAAEPGHSLADDALLKLGILHHSQGHWALATSTLERFTQEHSNSPLLGDALYWLGTVRSDNEKWSKAIVAFRAAVAASQDSDERIPAIRFALAQALRENGELANAAEAYQVVHKQFPTSEWADDSLQLLVRLAFDAGSYEQTAELSRSFSEQFPDSPLLELVQQLHGRMLLSTQRYEEAVSVFEQLAIANKDDMKANRYYLGLAYLGANQPEPALDSLDKVTLEGEETDLRTGLLVARSSALIALKRHADAIAPLQQYLQLRPDGPDNVMCRARLIIALTETGDLNRAAETQTRFAAAGTEDPLLYSSTLFLADTANATGEDELAARLYDSLAQVEDNVPVRQQGLIGLVRLHSKNQDFVEAAQLAEQLLQDDLSSEVASEMLWLKARAFENTGQQDEAVAAYQQLYEDHPQSRFGSTATLAAAMLHMAAQRAVEADALFAQVIEQYPESNDAAKALYERAWLLHDQQQFIAAEHSFGRLVADYPDSEYWHDSTFRVAQLAFDQGRLQEAESTLSDLSVEDQSSCTAEPQLRCHALFLLGQVSVKRKEWTVLKDRMRTITEEFADHSLYGPARYWLGEACFRLQEYSEAAEHFLALCQLTQGSQEDWVAMVRLRQAQLAGYEEDWQTALEVATQIVEEFPEFQQQYEVDYLLGRSLAAQAKFTQARDAYLRVLDSQAGKGSETAAMAQWMIGETYFLQQDYTRAIRSYHRVVILFAHPRWQAASLLQAGKCHELLQQWQQAASTYQRLIKEFADSDFTEEADRRLQVAQVQAESLQ